MNMLKKIHSRSSNYEDYLVDSLKDPIEAAAYLGASLEAHQEDGDNDALLLALKHLAKAQGGIASLAKKTKLNRQALYKVLSSSGNPRLDTFETIIHALGFKLAVVQEEPAKYQKSLKKKQ
jgi:probable addiction module antidote protein